MNEQKQIEEIQAILPNIEVVKAMYGDFDLAKLLYDRDVRKIPKGAVVILDEEMEEFAEKLAKSQQMQKVMNDLIKAWQKETLEKVMEDCLKDTLTISTRDYGSIEVVPLDRISEICENILKGGKQ